MVCFTAITLTVQMIPFPISSDLQLLMYDYGYHCLSAAKPPKWQVLNLNYQGDVIKEGQVVGYVDQFGCELPVKVRQETISLSFSHFVKWFWWCTC